MSCALFGVVDLNRFVSVGDYAALFAAVLAGVTLDLANVLVFNYAADRIFGHCRVAPKDYGAIVRLARRFDEREVVFGVQEPRCDSGRGTGPERQFFVGEVLGGPWLRFASRYAVTRCEDVG